jgi:prepilin-type N-terminal cleavage/methylation domain-containing protein
VRARAGFTLLELLTALIVLGIASTILLKMFLSSQTLAKAGRTHEIAADLAQEFVTLLQDRPELFLWPSFLDEKPGTALPIKALPEGPLASAIAEPPASLPLLRRAHDREEGTYRNFSWSATGRLPAAESNYVELNITVVWELEGRLRQFMLTSATPRPAVGGAGR